MSARTAVVCAAAFFFVGGPALANKSALDYGLTANYSATATSVSFSICGYLKDSDGCYASETLQPFTSACAVIEGERKTVGNVISRNIYILDRGTSGQKAASLYVYKRTDTITDTADTVAVNLTRQVLLRLEGGSDSTCAMAANNFYVYAGTSADFKAAIVDQRTFKVTHSGGFTPRERLVSITADERGYVALHFSDGFFSFAPTGAPFEGGGGAVDMVGTRNAWVPVIKP